jgi:hypothetical protein
MDSFTRRDALKGGGLLATLWVLGGCQSSLSSDGPTPVAPGAGSPVISRTPTRPGVASSYTPPQPAPAPQPAPQVGDIQARSTWTRAGVARVNDINPMRGVSRITIHHDGMNVFTSTQGSAAAARLEQIRLAHVRGRGWADIGYHYIIDPAGRVWEGRSVQYQGAHVENNNENNLGIMCMGNFDQQTPSTAQLATLDGFLAAQMRLYRVPIARVYTHQELKATACPGRALQKYMVRSRSRGGNLAMACAMIPGLGLA